MTETEGPWAWWPGSHEPVRVLGHEDLWGRTIADVLVPSDDRAVRVDADDLRPLAQRAWTTGELRWRAAALRALALTLRGEPLAVRGGGVRLLPHQLATLTRAIQMKPVRLGVCDEVGLGKTITAGAIASELRARGRADRVLVVAPKGVQLQWVAEMSEHFGEDYVRVGPEGVPIDGGVNVWRAFDRVVTSIDAVKPLRARAGWSPEQVRRYNEERFVGLVQAGWGLVIIDEAQHVAGSDESVARHRLARELSFTVPNVLLLSATPHSGKSDSFRRFLGLLDPRFFEGRPVTRTSVQDVVARTEKRGAVDRNGEPLFQPRTTHLEQVPWGSRNDHQRLYDAVTEYVRDGYASARSTGRTATGFLMLLFQRLLASSTPAILSALERRSLAVTDSLTSGASRLDFEEWHELTGEEQLAAVDGDGRRLLDDEVNRLESIVELARACLSSGPDPKTLHFLSLVRRLRREEQDLHLKILVFTEFRATQQMLIDVLEAQGIPTATVNGEMGLRERAISQQRFRDTADVLVSTDAGGEGVNLQFAHVVVNWDLPWAPTRIEQRIGRVDRIGQTHPVRAFNLVLENSVDLRVLEVLQDKLDTIQAELGADKRADIIDSADRLVENVYVRAIEDPDDLDAAGTEFLQHLRDDLETSEDARALLTPTTRIVARNEEPQLPIILNDAAESYTAVTGRRLDDPADVLDTLPVIAPGEPVPTVSAGVRGWLTIWTVESMGNTHGRGAYAVFLTEDGRVDPHHADRIWRRLCDHTDILDTVVPDTPTWVKLADMGPDFGFHPLQQLAVPDGLPRLQLALLVRVLP